jgi:hypothetical protein
MGSLLVSELGSLLDGWGAGAGAWELGGELGSRNN